MSRTAQPVFLGLYNGSPFSLHPRRSRRIFLIASPRLSPSRSPPFSLPHSFVVPRPSPISRLSTLASTIRLCSGSRVAFLRSNTRREIGDTCTPPALPPPLSSRSSLRAYLWIRLPGRRADRKFRIPQLYGSLRACKRPEETLGARMCVSRRRNTNGHRVRRRRCAKMNEF